jgi:hypothetical protein
LEYVVIPRGVESAFVDIVSKIDLQRLLRLERIEYAASKSFCDKACVARWLRLACSSDRRCDKSRKDDGEPHRGNSTADQIVTIPQRESRALYIFHVRHGRVNGDH